MAKERHTASEGVVIKKYANRRLYNTAASEYVTLETLAAMVKEGVDFQVVDAKSGEDITRSVLTQIIFEQEGRGQNLLPVNFLRQLIRFYGDSMQTFVPGYLEFSLDSLMREQDKYRAQLNDLGGAPFQLMEEHAKRNMELFQQTVNMFNPFAEARAPEKPAAESESKATVSDIDTLRDQVGELQRKLEELASGGKRN